MKALSIRQPWAWLILNAGKDVENRNWRTNYRGRVLIHAAKGMTRNEYDECVFESLIANQDCPPVPPFEQLQRGGIVGSMEIVDCVSNSHSRWFCGHYGFVLRDPRPMPFIPLKGSLGFFDVPGIEL